MLLLANARSYWLNLKERAEPDLFLANFSWKDRAQLSSSLPNGTEQIDPVGGMVGFSMNLLETAVLPSRSC